MSGSLKGSAGMYLILAGVVGTGLGAADPAGVVVEVEVEAGAHDRQGTPVVLALPDSLAASRTFSLTSLDDDRPRDVQFLAAERPSVVWILRDRLAAGKSRRYRLRSSTEPAARGGVSASDDGKRLRLAVGRRPVLEYRGAVVESPAGIARLFRRSGQIHPLFTPSGRVVTDDFPPDHAHQHGVFFAWVDTTFEGRHVDFWNQAGQTGGVGHAEVLGLVEGPVYAQFRVRLRHDDLSAPGGAKPVLDETLTVRTYDRSDAFLVDYESSQRCAGKDPLTINRYHYGGFGLRGNRGWFDPGAKGNDPPDPARSGRSDFLTSEGKTRRDGNHTRPRWVDLHGEVDGAPSGVAVLDHPSNFRFPQPVRLHPNKPYFCLAPMVAGEFSIVPGTPYVSRYRLLVHDGPADSAAIDRAWRDYAEPPAVKVVNPSP